MARDQQIILEMQELAPALAGLPARLPYSVPEGYFAGLPMRMLEIIREENPQQELAAISPLLAGMNKRAPYSVPDGYFDSVRPIQQPLAPVVKMSFPARAVRIAAAAVVAGLIGISAWLMLKPDAMQAPARQDILSNLSAVSENEMSNYVEGNFITLIDDQAMASADVNDDDITLMFVEVPDKELENYLN